MIVFFSTVPPIEYYGMGRAALEWAKAFERAGLVVKHLGYEKKRPLFVPVFLYNLFLPLFYWSTIRNASCILVHEPLSMFFPITFKKYVIVSHGLEERAVEVGRKNGYVKSGFLRMTLWGVKNYLLKQAFKHACHTLVCNNTDMDYLVKQHRINCKKVSVLQHGFYEYTERIGGVKEKITILFNGAWTERKGISIVTKFIQYVLVTYEFVNFIVLTSGVAEQDFYDNFSETYRSRLQLKLNFGYKEELDCLSKSQVFLLTSFFEGQPLSLLQAMANGLCPIVSNNSGQIDLVRNGINGCVFETGNFDALRQAFDALILNRSEINRMGFEAKASVEGRTWNNVSDRLVAQLLSCIN